MVQILSVEEIEREYAEHSIRAYLNGTQGCSEKWIAGVLRAVEPSTAMRILQEISGPLREIHAGRFAFLERVVFGI